MKLELSGEATEYGRVAQQAIGAAGGDDLLQAAEAQPEKRESLVGPILDELGAWQLDPRASADELEAAAALCRAVGWWGLGYPIAERLARPQGLDAGGLLAVGAGSPAAPVDGLDLRWVAVSLAGDRYQAVPRPATEPVRRSAFVVGLDLHPLDGADPSDLPLALVLPCWTLLGMLDRALELTRAHITSREQFGQTLATFQGVQFQLTDAEVERVGLEELAKHALWSVQTGQDAAATDALALRLAAIEAADTVFRIAHQLHGAVGFCDETVLSWVSRSSVPLRRLPLNLAGTTAELTRRLGRHGLSGLFGPAVATS